LRSQISWEDLENKNNELTVRIFSLFQTPIEDILKNRFEVMSQLGMSTMVSGKWFYWEYEHYIKLLNDKNKDEQDRSEESSKESQEKYSNMSNFNPSSMMKNMGNAGNMSAFPRM
jgi:hypothetical protein